MLLIQRKLNTKLCTLYLVASESGLKGVHWDKQSVPMETVRIPILDQTEQQITEYLDGQRQDFDLPLETEGTTFQKKVWEQLKKIPYGTTCSYKDIAERIQNKNAYRAVGTANGHNPLSIIVPCHRVIAADGTLGGYGGGLEIKSKLLKLEILASQI